MKSIKIYFSLIITILFLASCEKEIEFKGETTDPKVVVNSYIAADSIITAHISESRFFLTNGYTFKNIENASVNIFKNGVLMEKMTYVGDGIYTGTIKSKPIVGETIKLVVNVPTKNEVSCETKIELQSVILSIDTTQLVSSQSPISIYNSNNGTLETVGYYVNYECKYKLKMKDNANEKNYYRLVVRTHSIFLAGGYSDSYSFTFDDIVSGNSNKNEFSLDGNPSNEYNVFSDEIFNGKEYSLSFSTSQNTAVALPGYDLTNITRENLKTEVYIDLQSISKSYYLYLKSRSASTTSNSFFSEPIQIHNNIDGGIGILGSYSSNVRKIDL